jgi:sterol 3beta-glucosyltransferase
LELGKLKRKGAREQRLMEITILATGSRGDTQPFVALGVGLQQAGYQVRLISNADLESSVQPYGLRFHPLQVDMQAVMDTDLVQSYLGSNNLLAGLRHFATVAPRISASLAGQAWQICRKTTSCLIYSLIDLYGYDIAQKLNVPAIQAHPQPMTPTCAFPPPTLSWPNLGGALNRLTYLLVEQVGWRLIFRRMINRFRQKTLELPPIGLRGAFALHRQQKIPILQPFSPTVLPRPADWPEWIYLTGYWFLPRPPAWQPAPDLIKFINGGSPPVYVGFGSMANREPEAITQLTLQALKLSGHRAVLARGWGGLGGVDLPANVFLLEAVPHDWLFPQMAAVVHHGGAGTTAAGLRAGAPSLLVPHIQDQFFWGKRVYELGVGPKPIPRKKLTAEKLAQALIEATNNGAIQARARQIGAKIQAEDGIGQAIEVIRRYIG